MEKKVLFEERAEIAERQINNIHNVYISPVNAVLVAIDGLKIGIPTKEMLFDVLFNDGKNIKPRFDESLKNDTGGIMNEVIERIAADKWNMVTAAADSITKSRETIFNGMCIRNRALMDWVDVNDGIATLNPAKEESIRESCRVYIHTAAGLKMYHLQKTIVDALQELHDMLHDVMENDNQELTSSARFVYFHPSAALFETHDDDADDCRTIFTMRKINFDPDMVDEEPTIED